MPMPFWAWHGTSLNVTRLPPAGVAAVVGMARFSTLWHFVTVSCGAEG